MKKISRFDRELHLLSALPDDKIDTSDIPEIKDWTGAQRGKFYRPGTSHLLPVFVDAEIVEFLANEAERRDTDVSSLGNALLHCGIGMITSRERSPSGVDSRHRDSNGEIHSKREEGDVSATKKSGFKPAQRAPASGEYREAGSRGGLGHEFTVKSGKSSPPTTQKGASYTLSHDADNKSGRRKEK